MLVSVSHTTHTSVKMAVAEYSPMKIFTIYRAFFRTATVRHEDEKLRCMKEEVPRTSGEMSGRRLFVRLSIDECVLVYSVYDVT